MKIDYTKRYYFHISKKDLHLRGTKERFTLHPKGGVTELRLDTEPDVKRICVGPSIIHCLSAIPAFCDGYNIYRTINKVKAHFPYDVTDAHITHERWLLEPTEFKLIGTWDLNYSYNLVDDTAYNINVGHYIHFYDQEMMLRYWRRFLSENDFESLAGVTFFEPIKKSHIFNQRFLTKEP